MTVISACMARSIYGLAILRRLHLGRISPGRSNSGRRKATPRSVSLHHHHNPHHTVTHGTTR